MLTILIDVLAVILHKKHGFHPTKNKKGEQGIRAILSYPAYLENAIEWQKTQS